MKILVTGCGRSGTAYMATLLSYIGLRSGHEQIYHDKIQLDVWNHKDAESSWFAVPFLDDVPSDVIVYHQLRNPLKVVTCWSGHRLLTDSAAGIFVYRYLPECFVGSDLERSVRYVFCWNKIVEKWGERYPYRYFRYRVEDLDPIKLRSMLSYSGYPNFDLNKIQFALDEGVPKNVNSCHHNADFDVTWSQILELGEIGISLREMAEYYGYCK